MTNETALKLVDVSQYTALAQMDEEMAAIMEENLLGQTLGPNDLTRVTFPREGTLFQWTEAGESLSAKELTGVPLAQRRTRVLFLRSFDPREQAMPNCFSDDGVTGSPRLDEQGNEIDGPVPYGGPCVRCPMDAWGSGVDQQGNPTAGKRCTEYRHVLLLQENEQWPVVLRLPPGQLRVWDEFCRDLTKRRLRISETVITVSVPKERELSVRLEGRVDGKVAAQLRQLVTDSAEQLDDAVAPEVPDPPEDDLPF